MGYTHYWKTKEPITRIQWDELTAVVKNAVRRSNTTVVYEYMLPNYLPLITPYEIQFNGPGDQGHETFLLQKAFKRNEFAFCKTARKPYDVVVTAVLCLAHTIAPDTWEITSDGDAEDWEEGLALAKQVLENAESPIG